MSDFITGLAFVSVVTIMVSLILGALGILEYVVVFFAALLIMMICIIVYETFEGLGK